MATERQVAANRINGLKGGVKTEAGKAISRLNARKHGIFALALTEEDAAQLRGIEEEMKNEPNLSQVPTVAGDGAVTLINAGCQRGGSVLRRTATELPPELGVK